MGRLRTNTKAPELIKEFTNYIDLDSFQIPKQPVYLEIGCGKGDFLIENAIKHPDIFFLGIEKYSTVILKALKKIKRNNLKLDNLVFSCADAEKIDLQKFKNSVSKLYLNFSDPWPKKRHVKRRLTSPNFLNLYNEILKKDAMVEFKTDNEILYEYSLGILKNRKDFQVIYNTDNLYNDFTNNFNIYNVQTEYEKKFVNLNKNIYKIVFKSK